MGVLSLSHFDTAKVRKNDLSYKLISEISTQKSTLTKKIQIWYRWQMAVVIMRTLHKRYLIVNYNII